MFSSKVIFKKWLGFMVLGVMGLSFGLTSCDAPAPADDSDSTAANVVGPTSGGTTTGGAVADNTTDSSSTTSGGTSSTTSGGTSSTTSGGTSSTTSGGTSSTTSGGTSSTTSGGTQSSTSRVALTGLVAAFPEGTTSSGRTVRLSDYSRLSEAETANCTAAESAGTIKQECLPPAKAMVSLYLLSDTDLKNVVATVRTGSDGKYNIRAEHVKKYLVDQNKVSNDASDADIIAAFKLLGKMQVRAVIVRKDSNGNEQPMAMTSIGDPNNLDDKGEPNVTKVNPIVHRLVKQILTAVKTALDPIRGLLGDGALADTLIKAILSSVEDTVTTVLATADTSTISIPDGQSASDVFNSQEKDLVVTMDADQLASLQTELAKKDETVAASSVVLSASATNTNSNLSSSLSSEESGLLAGLSNTMSQGVYAIAAADSQFSSVTSSASFAESKNTGIKLAIQRFFLTMGFPVLVAQDNGSKTSVVVVNLPAPPHLSDAEIPGMRALGEPSYRAFKIGSGTITGDFASAPSLANESNPAGTPTKLAGLNQAAIDAAQDKLFKGTATSSDSRKVDRVRLFHEMARTIQNGAGTLISDEAIAKLIDNNDKTIAIKDIAAILAKNFKWVSEPVNITPEGFPIFSGRQIAPTSGATVDSSQLIRALSITLGTDPVKTANLLTQSENFYSMFSGNAINANLQRLQQKGSFNLDEVEAQYPATKEGYKDLVLGNRAKNIPATPAFVSASDAIARGLTAAIPQNLYGQTLTSETKVNIQTAFFLLNMLLERTHLIEDKKGFYTEIKIKTTTRWRPNFENFKELVPKSSDVSIAGIIASLLNITTIQNSAAFTEAASKMSDPKKNLLSSSLPELPEFKAQNLTQFLGTNVSSVTVQCTVGRYDGLDPNAGINNSEVLNLNLFPVSKDNGQFFKGEALTAGTDYTLDKGSYANKQRTYSMVLSAENNVTFPGDFVIRFGIDSYSNDLPEFQFYIDGFSNVINVCPKEFPYMIGSDQKMVNIPGMGLTSDQQRGIEFDSKGKPTKSQPEGVDLSNFKLPGAPIMVTESDETAGRGKLDFYLVSVTGGKYSLKVKDTTNAAFAPLYQTMSDTEGLGFTLTVTAGEELQGISPVVGRSLRTQTSSFKDKIDAKTAATSITLDPAKFINDQVFLFRDPDKGFWVIELRFIDVMTDPSGQKRAVLNFGFAEINSRGEVQIAEAGFNAGPISNQASQAGIQRQNLAFGDWLVLEAPSGFNGPQQGVIAPKQVDWDSNNSLAVGLESATSGIFIRYAGEYFNEKISSVADFGANFDYSKVPVRLDAGRSGITFVKLQFKQQTRSYVMSPKPESAIGYITGLTDGDIVAIREGSSYAYMARVVRNRPSNDPQANMDIGLEIVKSEKQVFCLGTGCTTSSTLPKLYYDGALQTAIGDVFDADFDGVPAIFDPNDGDPNIKPSSGTVANAGTSTNAGSAGVSSGGGSGIEITSIVEEGSTTGSISRSFIIRTRGVYPGDIRSVTLQNASIFPDATEYYTIFTCDAPKQSEGSLTALTCTAKEVTGLKIAQDFVSSEEASFKITPSQNSTSFTALKGKRTKFVASIKFRKSLDLDGNPLKCGAMDCEARPSITTESQIMVPAAGQTIVFSNVKIQVGAESAQLFSEVEKNKTSIDIGRDIVISADSISDATDYQLEIYCAGKESMTEFISEFRDHLYEPAKGPGGVIKKPEFRIGPRIPGGRSCDFTLTSFLSTAGELIGASIADFDGITTTGGATAGVNNELKLATNDAVCFTNGMVEFGATCSDPTKVLFTVTAMTDQASASLTFGSNVGNAAFGSAPTPLTEGKLDFNKTAQIKIDSITKPTCGEISTDSYSKRCGVEKTPVAILESNGGSVLTLASTVSDWLILKDKEQVTSIDLNQPGFYRLGPSDGAVIEMDGNKDFINVRSASNESKIENAGGTSKTINPGSFLYVALQEQQGVDFDIRFINSSQMKVAWFLPPPSFGLVGDHDFDGDGNKDVSVVQSGNQWTFTFGSKVSSVQFENPPGVFTALTRNAINIFEKTVDSSTNNDARFDVSLDSGKSFKFEGQKIQSNDPQAGWFELFIGPAGGDGNGTNGSELFNANLFTQNVAPVTAKVLLFQNDFFSVDQAGIQLGAEMIRVYLSEKKVKFNNGWKINVEGSDATELELKYGKGGIFRISNATLNREYDLDITYLWIDNEDNPTAAEIQVRILPPGNSVPTGPGEGGGSSFESSLGIGTHEIYYSNRSFFAGSTPAGDTKILTLTISSSQAILESADTNTFDLQGPGVVSGKVTQPRKDQRENFYNVKSTNADVQNFEFVMYADLQEVSIRIQPPPSFFERNLFQNDAIVFFRDQDPMGNTFLRAESQFVSNETNPPSDLNNGGLAAVMMVTRAGKAQLVPVTANGWTITTPEGNSVDNLQNSGFYFLVGTVGEDNISYGMDVNIRDNSAYVKLQPGGGTGPANGPRQFPLNPMSESGIFGNAEFEIIKDGEIVSLSYRLGIDLGFGDFLTTAAIYKKTTSGPELVLELATASDWKFEGAFAYTEAKKVLETSQVSELMSKENQLVIVVFSNNYADGVVEGGIGFGGSSDGGGDTNGGGSSMSLGPDDRAYVILGESKIEIARSGESLPSNASIVFTVGNDALITFGPDWHAEKGGSQMATIYAIPTGDEYALVYEGSTVKNMKVKLDGTGISVEFFMPGSDGENGGNDTGGDGNGTTLNVGDRLYVILGGDQGFSIAGNSEILPDGASVIFTVGNGGALNFGKSWNAKRGDQLPESVINTVMTEETYTIVHTKVDGSMDSLSDIKVHKTESGGVYVLFMPPSNNNGTGGGEYSNQMPAPGDVLKDIFMIDSTGMLHFGEEMTQDRPNELELQGSTRVNISGTGLEGSWEAPCVEDMENPNETTRETLIVTGNQFISKNLRYGDANCKMLLIEVVFSGTFTTGNHVNTPTGEATEIDFALTSVQIFAKTSDIVNVLNQQQICGFTDWMLDQPKNTGGLNCSSGGDGGGDGTGSDSEVTLNVGDRLYAILENGQTIEVARSGETVPTGATVIFTVGSDGSLKFGTSWHAKKGELQPTSSITPGTTDEIYTITYTHADNTTDNVTDIRIHATTGGVYVSLVDDPTGSNGGGENSVFELANGDQIYRDASGELQSAAESAVPPNATSIIGFSADFIHFYAGFRVKWPQLTEFMTDVEQPMTSSMILQFFQPSPNGSEYVSDLRISLSTTGVKIEFLPPAGKTQ
ncbi:hypothetical protein WDW89_15990 [Deltaproteobacteria bacterium TL4]